MLGLQNYVWISPGRRSHTKRKPSESFHVEVPYWRYVPINVIKRERFNAQNHLYNSLNRGIGIANDPAEGITNDNILQAAQPVPPCSSPIRGPASELRGDGAQQTILGVGGWHPAEQPTSTRQLVQLVKGFTMVQTESSPGKMVDGNNI